MLTTSESELSIRIKLESRSKKWLEQTNNESVRDMFCDASSCFSFARVLCLCASSRYLWRYRLDKTIGKGSFGNVFEIVRLSDNHVFACKFQSKKKTVDMLGGNLVRAIKRVRSEIDFAKKLSHPNIVKVYEVSETDSHILTVMERMYGGTLCSYAMRRDLVREDHVAIIVSQILKAVSYIHSVGLVHRDIKLENIMLTKKFQADEPPIVKLIDFGCSRALYASSKAESFVGSGYFAAPEIFLRSGHNSKADMWSVGVVTFVCLSGKFPFRDSSGPVGQYVKGLETAPHVKQNDWIGISDNALDFTRKLLRFHPATRMSASEAANHPWLTKIGEK